MLKIKRFFLIACAAAVSLGVGLYSNVGAVDVPDYRLQISPPTQKIELNPGDEYTGSFQVQNTGNKGFRYTISVSPYGVSGDNYDPNYEDSSSYTQIVNWINIEQTEGWVDAGSFSEVVYYVSVPYDVPAGGQYAIIFAELDTDDSTDVNVGGASIKNVSRVGTIIYAHVNGETREDAKILNNSIPIFNFGTPITVSSLIKNDGNVDIEAKYTLTVYSIFDNDAPVYTNEENPDTRIILPETQRLNNLTWENSPKLGIFKVSQKIEVLDESSTVEKIVLVCPLWFMLTVLALIFLCVIWIISRVRKRNK